MGLSSLCGGILTVEIIKLNDKPTICPKCKTPWTNDSFTTNSEEFKPKCGFCGYVWGK